jgi:signal peptidase I
MLLTHLKISGHSMEPTILDGQSILASSITFLFSKLKTGDIVVFESKNKLIVKRVKEIKGNLILVGGDNSSDSKDFGWIGIKEIKGKVIAKL